MPSFTWKHSDNVVPIAKDIENKRILFMNKSEDYDKQFGKENRDFDVSDIARNKLSMKRLDLLRQHLIKSVEPLDDEIKSFYQVAQEKKEREVSLRSGTFDPMPSGVGREIVYITAPSGAGKSTWVSKYSRNY